MASEPALCIDCEMDLKAEKSSVDGPLTLDYLHHMFLDFAENLM